MIEFTKSYKTEDGRMFGTIVEAQLHELSLAFKNHPELQSPGDPVDPWNEVIARIVFDNRDLVMDILTMTPNSKPKARAIHGGTKKRTPKVSPVVTTDKYGV